MEGFRPGAVPRWGEARGSGGPSAPLPLPQPAWGWGEGTPWRGPPGVPGRQDGVPRFVGPLMAGGDSQEVPPPCTPKGWTPTGLGGWYRSGMGSAPHFCGEPRGLGWGWHPAPGGPPSHAIEPAAHSTGGSPKA